MATSREVLARVIDVLDGDESLDIDSQQQTYDPEDEVLEVDWEGLFPSSRKTGEETDEPRWPILPGELAEEFDRIARGDDTFKPPRVDSEGNSEVAHWDICAWYQPIHYFGIDFGIFIREDCLIRQALSLAQVIYGGAPGRFTALQLAEKSLKCSFLLYYFHEQFHHKVESFGIRAHVIGGPMYLNYKAKVYRPSLGTEDCLEEALANAESYLRLKEQTYKHNLGAVTATAAQRYVKSTFPSDPPGYRQAVNYLKRPAFEAGLNNLQAQIHETTLKPVRPADYWQASPHVIRGLFPLKSEIYAVVRHGKTPLLPTARITPKYSTAATQRACEKRGYRLVPGGKGSHIKLKKEGNPTIILPGNRKSLSPGVLKSVKHALGATSIEAIFP